MSGKNTAHDAEREVRKMLVIDRIEFGALDKTQQMRKFQRERAAWFEKFAQPCDEVVQCGNVRQDVVGYDEVGLAVDRLQPLGRTLTEKSDLGAHAAAHRCRRHIGSRLDAEHRYGAARKTLQQMAVVAAHFCHQASLSELQPLYDIGGITLDVLAPSRRIRREVNVVAKDLVRRFKFGQLDEPAALADKWA